MKEAKATKDYFQKLRLELDACPTDREADISRVTYRLLNEADGNRYKMAGRDEFDSLDELWRAWFCMQPVFRRNECCARLLSDASINWTDFQHAQMKDWLGDLRVKRNKSMVVSLVFDRTVWPWTEAKNSGYDPNELRTYGWPWSSIPEVSPLEFRAVSDNHLKDIHWKETALYLGSFDHQRAEIYSQALARLISEAPRLHLEKSLTVTTLKKANARL